MTVLKLRGKRHRDLARLRNQAACRLHSLLASLVPGGISKEITPGQAERLLAGIGPSAPAAVARHQLAAEYVADLRHPGAQLRAVRARLADAVKACGTSVTQVLGVGPVIAAIVVGDVEDVARFRSRDAFASYNGTAPIEVSSGSRVTRRLSQRGNRRLNHAIHMAAVTQIRHPHSDGRTYYDRKIAEGKTPKEALRCLKRRVSDAIWARLRADAQARPGQASAGASGPGGQPGNDSASSVADSHPERRLFGSATPGPEPQLTPANRLPPAKTRKSGNPPDSGT